MASYKSRASGVAVDTRDYSAVLIPDLAFGPNLLIHMTLTGNVTIANPANVVDGAEFTLRLLHSGAGHTIAFGSAYRGSNDTALPSTTGVDGATDYFAFKYNAVSGKCDFVAPNKGFS